MRVTTRNNLGNDPSGRKIRFYRALLLSMLLGFHALVQSKSGPEEYFDLTLGELLDLEVTSLSKRPQPLSQAAAAVFVITREDIRRSGATSIPEALRMAPGIQVARIDADKWAITSRGFNGRFANKLLVMIDGRSVYTPLFSGVYWDVQDTLLEDIARIEVIRGPGATLWGANAVNGVINIITEEAADTRGGLLSAGTGNEERGFVHFRYGAEIADLGHYRIYGKYFNRDGSVNALSGAETADDWDQFRTGFRTELVVSDTDDLNIQGDYYRGRHGETVGELSLSPPFHGIADHDTDVSGFNLLARWNHWVSDSDDFALQAYFDRTEREWARAGEDRDTFDLDFQYRTQRFVGHDLILGLGYRYTEDSVRSNLITSMIPGSRSDNLFSAFVQDDIELVPRRWTLTLGSKFEHNDYTGFEIQPNARLLWTPNERQTLWASVARAVRTPGRADHDSRSVVDVIPPASPGNPAPVPLMITVQGDERIESEVLIAYEAGFKWQAGPTLGLDLALFYNDYDRLRSFQIGTPICLPGGIPPDCFFTPPPPAGVLVPSTLGDLGEGGSYGVELAADWQPSANWRLKAVYTYLEQVTDDQLEILPGYAAGVNPRHQFSLRSLFNPRSDVDLDLWIRYVDRLDDLFGLNEQVIDAYWQLDVRAAWRPQPDVELSLVGQNLLDDAHPEFLSELGDVPLTAVERSVYGQVRWEF